MAILNTISLENNKQIKISKMENFIRECRSGFDFSSVSSRSRVVNANRLQVHALAYTCSIGSDDRLFPPA